MFCAAWWLYTGVQRTSYRLYMLRWPCRRLQTVQANSCVLIVWTRHVTRLSWLVPHRRDKLRWSTWTLPYSTCTTWTSVWQLAFVTLHWWSHRYLSSAAFPRENSQVARPLLRYSITSATCQDRCWPYCNDGIAISNPLPSAGWSIFCVWFLLFTFFNVYCTVLALWLTLMQCWYMHMFEEAMKISDLIF